jgi:hypothetical protein
VSNDFRRIVTLAVGLPLDASDDEIATKLGELLGAKQSARAVSEGAKKFDELVGEAMATHKLSYGLEFRSFAWTADRLSRGNCPGRDDSAGSQGLPSNSLRRPPGGCRLRA